MVFHSFFGGFKGAFTRRGMGARRRKGTHLLVRGYVDDSSFLRSGTSPAGQGSRHKGCESNHAVRCTLSLQTQSIMGVGVPIVSQSGIPWGLGSGTSRCDAVSVEGWIGGGGKRSMVHDFSHSCALTLLHHPAASDQPCKVGHYCHIHIAERILKLNVCVRESNFSNGT